jgi:regulatory protein
MRKKALLSAEALWAYALKALGARAQSTGELRQKLIGRAERPADVEHTIARLRDYGYLNDTRFAENYAGARLENEGLGKSRVLRDLRERKVSSSLAQSTVNRLYGKLDEMELIANFIRRKIKTKEPLPEALEDPRILGNVYRKLLRAGFSSSKAIGALKRIAKKQDLLDSFEPPEEMEAE